MKMVQLVMVFILFVSHLANAIDGKSDKPLNVLFILTDDQAIDTIGAHGNNRISTPNINSLAKKGMSFTHVFNQGSWSPAVCAPSRRMINSGRHIFHTGMGPNNHKQGNDAKDFKMFGETFKEAGYTTFMSGKWHLPMPIFERSFTEGKAVFKGGMAHLKNGGQWQADYVDYNDKAKGDEKYHAYKGDKHSSEMIAEAAMDFLYQQQAANKKANPFMMYVAFLAPHDPRQSPDSYVARYPGNSINLPISFLPEHPFDQGDHYIRDENLADFPRTPAVVKEFIGEYYAMIEHMDSQIGRVLEALEASGQADNTLIVFTSDHGLAVGKHGLLGKQNQYDHSVRAPFIVKGPNVPQGKTAKGMFYISSAFPTAVDMAGLKIPESVQMPSVAALIRGEKVRGDKDTMFDSIYSSYRHFQRMLRTDDYKLIYYPHLKKTQLFNMQTDPNELVNLADNPEHTKRISAMMVKLESWKQIVADPLDNNDIENSFKVMGGVKDKDHRSRDRKNKANH
ncbi:sulfatase-like hydrolase/transferase [Thalassotalea psychrophila]|uniref:Sulfatase-like hydrolase/transferase n=1 Tax=Thalassotalea psychrophila TaxID=3065647 RepID=A0ABY9TYD2_9GAMM|nr:sulfatase-like hydrolase/transferase [Colwelliaceae bacterium SQ149]